MSPGTQTGAAGTNRGAGLSSLHERVQRQILRFCRDRHAGAVRDAAVDWRAPPASDHALNPGVGGAIESSAGGPTDLTDGAVMPAPRRGLPPHCCQEPQAGIRADWSRLRREAGVLG